MRNSACEYKQAWQAYNCSGNNVLDYRMLVIENLDDDTETRRLSPVALVGDRYIDLNNGKINFFCLINFLKLPTNFKVFVVFSQYAVKFHITIIRVSHAWLWLYKADINATFYITVLKQAIILVTQI